VDEGWLLLKPIGTVESPDRIGESAPLQGREGSPDAWLKSSRLRWVLGRFWAPPDPQTFKVTTNIQKTFVQLVVPIRYGSELLETLRSDLSRR